MDERNMTFLTYSSHGFLVINSEEVYSTVFSNRDNLGVVAHHPRAWRTAPGRTAWPRVVVRGGPLLAGCQRLGVRNDHVINQSKVLNIQHFSPIKECFKCGAMD